ncbi:hypothetical protein NA56DRAFT_751951 [Hyaloscypha hepaticicola]|uniref:Uncharacterized protein n=1 Tax=Hyaloscypha hepaticicola TaxID=2082293 RepID=A0A2J6PVA9_9HELO|nr:hypothetical protein NA56DRAFT_751951 [Hyaloscypha hepaticicola]
MGFGYTVGDGVLLVQLVWRALQRTRKACGDIVNEIVTKYNKLSDTERRARRIWQKMKFGNGEKQDLGDKRPNLSEHISAIIMSSNPARWDLKSVENS